MEAGLSALPAGPAVAAPPEWLEEAIGEGTAGGAVEVLKILAKSDPRSNTATFISQSWQFCPRRCLNLKTTGNPASELHPPPPAGIATRRPPAGRRSWGPRTPRSPGGLWCAPHAEGSLRALSPAALGTALPDALTTCRSLRLLAAQGAAATLCGEQSLLCPGAVRPPRAKGPGAHGGDVLQLPAPAPPRAEGGYLGLRPLEIPRRAPGTARAVAKLNKNPA